MSKEMDREVERLRGERTASETIYQREKTWIYIKI